MCMTATARAEGTEVVTDEGPLDSVVSWEVFAHLANISVWNDLKLS